MRTNWRVRLHAAVVTAAVTSIAWLGLFAWWQVRDRSEPPVEQRDPPRAGYATPARKALPILLPTPGSPSPEGIGMLAMPVAGVDPAELADTWNDSRAGGVRLHEAIDIMAPRGAPVAAAAAGAVEKLFLSVPGGKTIYLRSEDRRRLYYYAHLESYRPGLAEGQRVNRAEIIGTVGSTGNANPEGPHLHFEIRTIAPSEPWYGASVAINPYPLLVGRTVH